MPHYFPSLHNLQSHCIFLDGSLLESLFFSLYGLPSFKTEEVFIIQAKAKTVNPSSARDGISPSSP
jgi:hypothetical protein